MYYANPIIQKAGMAILISDKAYFKTKNIISAKKNNFKMIIHQEDIIILTIYESNDKA
jgi:hypothetical protein